MKTLSWFLFTLILACGQGNNSSSASYNESAVAIEDAAFEMEAMERQSAPKVVVDVAQPEQQIIKTGNLRFETQDLTETHASILSFVEKYRGFVQTDNSGKDYNRQYYNMTVRIPTTHFQETIDHIAKEVALFEEKTVSRRDVTEEFVDLEARLNAKRALETRYMDLLKKANTVEDILKIERELANIREEIESRQGRLEYLQNQVALSTLHIYFYKTVSENTVTTSYGRKVINALQGGWQGISKFFLLLLYAWPFLILGGGFIYWLVRWARRRDQKPSKN
ncbi:DUF4349 domain-containing protein [Croceiramulus getboli]|nr:DUF4349 domain-containing protein [Flavobacteriaceae bacterium YJPT1-3]